MPKKSNKTEHVLNLISKSEEVVDNEIENSEAEAEVPTVEQVEVRIKESPQAESELKIERKITIELEPEVTVKRSEEESLTIQIPRGSEQPEPSEETWPTMKPEEKRVYLVNLSEKLASEMVDEVMERLNVCNCQMCKNDILALALNSLTHNYVTTDAGKQYMLLEVYKKQYETDVLAALTKACVRVKASPKH